MIWETLGFLLTAFAASVLVLFRFTSDIFPKALKKALTKLAISNWQKRLPQKLPVYNFPNPKSSKDAGLFASDTEYEIEKPKEIEKPGNSDNLLLYGIDDDGNALVAEISRHWNNWTKVCLCLHYNGKKFSVSYEGESTNGYNFTLGNFKLEMVNPFRTWRLWYNGCLENIDSSEPGEDLIHATLNFLWKPLELPSDIQKNGNLELLSEYFCEKGLFGERLSDLSKLVPSGYFQFGSLHGTVNMSSEVLDHDDNGKQLYLYGYRHRQYLDSNVSSQEKDESLDRLELFGMCGTNGNAFRLVGLNDDWIDGETSYSSFDVKPIFDVDVKAKLCRRDNSMPKNFTISDSKTSQNIEVWKKLQKISTSNLEVVTFKLEMNGKTGRGILIRKLQSPGSERILMNSLLKNSARNQKETESLDFVDFYSNSCLRVDLVGGKGASLSDLAHLSLKMKTDVTNGDFDTAKGFCVTTTLFNRMIDMKKISEIIGKITLSHSDLDELCKEAMKVVKTSGAESQLASMMESFMSKVFGESRSNLTRYAVRSSGVLEDGSDLSCAGQNETFLGTDEKSIPLKIIQCWASLFTSQSVRYRLNHGQPAVSEMGVVIQEMVNASSAGVMFTADPRTGNPFEMLVTANYGLGESVVSASCDPDSITLTRPTNKVLFEQGKGLKISNKNLGEKKSKIVLSTSGNSTQELEINEQDSKNFCLDDATILRLGSIGVKIQSKLGHLKPVDIEWAVTEKGEIFILQCRAMTSLDAWTDFEILHEFDTAVRSKIERLTIANTAEVMPKPIYPLTVQSTNKTIDLGVQIRQSKKTGTPVCPLMSRNCPLYRQRFFISMLCTLYQAVDEDLSPAMSAIDLSLFGREMIDDEIHTAAKERYGVSSGKDKLLALYHAIHLIWKCTKILERAKNAYSKLKLNYDHIPQTSKAIHEKIEEDIYYLQDMAEVHCAMSEASSTTLIFAFMMLTEGKETKDWTPTLYEDTGTILSAYSAVESAEMPLDIDNLGTTIVKLAENPTDFLNLKSTNEAISWLRSNSDLAEALDTFLNKHGHRSIAEMDLGQKSWKTDPTPLLSLLKNIVRNKLESKESSTPETSTNNKKTFSNDDALLDSLKTPLKSGTRRGLKFLLPHCRKTVIYRETSKSLTVRTIEQLKQAYSKLVDLMLKEQLIPNADLLRFLTHHELGQLINKCPSTSTILYKAMRRQKLYPSLDLIDYPEISIGIPQPIDNSKLIEISDVIKGTPVSSGKVQGIAKVCLSVEQASEIIQPGDILITKATDIAWSPFFPVIGGVVTEMGGLISHGAVVAREYGLPCIVGAINATKIFKTGDEVVLDTSTGTLAKVKSTIQ